MTTRRDSSRSDAASCSDLGGESWFTPSGASHAVLHARVWRRFVQGAWNCPYGQRRTMAVNLNGAFLFCKHAIPAMEAGGGRVARAGRPWYCAAKGALIQLATEDRCRSAARGLGRHRRVTMRSG